MAVGRSSSPHLGASNFPPEGPEGYKIYSYQQPTPRFLEHFPPPLPLQSIVETERPNGQSTCSLIQVADSIETNEKNETHETHETNEF